MYNAEMQLLRLHIAKSQVYLDNITSELDREKELTLIERNSLRTEQLVATAVLGELRQLEREMDDL